MTSPHFTPSPVFQQPLIERGNCGIGFVADQYGRASHAILRQALQALNNLQHRGAIAADAQTGDGAGTLTPLPKRFFAREVERLTGKAVDPTTLGVGVFFFQPGTEESCRRLLEEACAEHGLTVLCWRDPPTDPSALGPRALATLPVIQQAIFSHHPSASNHPSFEHALYLARKAFEKKARTAYGAYVPSMSARTIVYKGLFNAPQLSAFYADLRDPDFEVALAVFHQRYSTNTLPTWQRAQPFRVLCHNGEINTLQGNINWMKAREPLLRAAFAEAEALRPVIDPDGSDSAMLDNVAELLNLGGRVIQHAITMLVPPAWERLPDLPEALRDFYEFHSCLTEPWDGPAALAFTDGVRVGVALDRNGLRPNRYIVTEDGLVIAGSEAGILPIDEARVQLKGKLGPGQALVVDTERGVVMRDLQVKGELAVRRPYGAWVRRGIRKLETADRRRQTADGGLRSDVGGLLAHQAAFGYTSEELVMVLRPMIETGAEAVGSMGDDTPSAVLSDKPRPLFGYFRQRFAEVTNPPIDPLREQLVMSLKVQLGARRNFLDETPAQAELLELDTPFLTASGLAQLRADARLKPVTLSTLFPVRDGAAGLAAALEALQRQAEVEVRAGAEVLILSDRGVDADHTFIPSLLALGAVHHHLLRCDLRTRVDFVVESGEPRDVHHFACLIGYGAAAIHPYVALATALELDRGANPPDEVIHRYLHAAEHGLLKIMSKMGISTVDAYCGAQIFEIIGLDAAVVEEYFAGTPAHLGGLDLAGIASIVQRWHAAAFAGEKPALDSPGFYKFKRNGERHAFSPQIVHALHEAVRTPAALDGRWAEGYAAYKKYSRLQHSREAIDPRDLLELSSPQSPIFIDQVEPASAILRRFSTAAMSHGALSKEAHETMAIAMNRLGAWSNSGEGGEDPARYTSEANDRIKQVASARFGVTTHYLVSADELQIKMAQGSKPGEGGQLPGHKVSPEIAAIRHATPGVTLISPPPHHDIYSIEDLAQLIYDLRQVNPRAAISVKLVAQAGVGTIAAGVAKAGADVILISGSSGGTGASPLSSIKYAGVPWELGLVEAQHMLIASGLRGRVRLRADGGMRTGRDIVVAALLGADEFSFGTAAAIAEGCVMARACHLNTCPAGIATQKPELRAKFDATPEHLMAFLLYVAEEVRELLAELGARSLEEIIGQVERLQVASSKVAELQAGRVEPLAFNLQTLLAVPGDGPRRYIGEPNPVPTASPLNAQLVEDYRRLKQAAALHQQFFYGIRNSDRTFGAQLAGLLARQELAGEARSSRRVAVKVRGSAGQSFGAFAVKGMELTLAGEANDYVGKGLTGGRIVIHPPSASDFPEFAQLLHKWKLRETRELRETWGQTLAGNTCLYGATSGEVYIAGRAGERFAVRNSGADAVVEGVGDHGCEYMTGGTVVVLGSIGYNFGAGMTGGVAYILDDGWSLKRINLELVRVEPPSEADLEDVRRRVQQHVALTRSAVGRALLEHWESGARHFIKIVPKSAPTASPEPAAALTAAFSDAQPVPA
jgi:glutamate synthase (ferredoxin)